MPAEAKLEGVDLFPVWKGRAPQIERTLFWRSGSGAAKQTAVRRGDWKLIVDGPHTYVFDLRTDLSERDDLAKWRQDVAQELYPLLTSWEASVDADAKALDAAAPSGRP